MFKLANTIFASLILTLCLTTNGLAADEPSMHEVYLAAEAGKFKEAQAMMDVVLKEHPNSAKAHFVEAELLAKQGLLAAAKTELNTAETLKPGLPFAKPETVEKLKNVLSVTTSGSSSANPIEQSLPGVNKDWLPALYLFIGLAVIIVLIGFLTRRNKPVLPNGFAGGNANSPHPNNTAYGNNAGGNVMNQPNVGQSSGIMGSLATGAALGAGVAAGEALVHHFLDGNDHSNQHPDNFTNHPVDNSGWNDNSEQNTFSNNADLGGNDFGIADNSSWDDDSFSSDSGDDDWT